MYIVCEQCDAKYKIKKHDIDERGRMVHCNHCDYEWIAHLEDANIMKKFSILPSISLRNAIIVLVLMMLCGVTYWQIDNIRPFASANTSLQAHNVSLTAVKDDSNSTELKIKVQNTSDTTQSLTNVLVMLYDAKGNKTYAKQVAFDINLLPQKGIVLPISLEGSNPSQIDQARIYIGGSAYLLYKRFVN